MSIAGDRPVNAVIVGAALPFGPHMVIKKKTERKTRPYCDLDYGLYVVLITNSQCIRAETLSTYAALAGPEMTARDYPHITA